MRLLIFATHTDDEALIGGGLIQKADEVLVISSCGSSSYREKVFNYNAKKYGYTTKNLNFGDCTLHLNIDKLADKMSYEIKKFKPTHILSNHWQDLHQDHIANSRAVEIATRPRDENTIGLNVLYGYGASLYETSEMHRKPNTYIELTKEEVDNKATMMENYESETRHNRNREAIETNSKMAGMMFGVKYAEMYYQSTGELK